MTGKSSRLRMGRLVCCSNQLVFGHYRMTTLMERRYDSTVQLSAAPRPAIPLSSNLQTALRKTCWMRPFRSCVNVVLSVWSAVSGIDAGTDVILIPEITFDIAHVARRLETAKEREHRFDLLIVAEGVKSPEGREVTARNAPGTEFCGGIGHTLAARLSKIVAADTRVTVLGHVQRDGIPAARDRLMASTFGLRAVDLLAEGARNGMVAWRSRAVIDVPIADAISTYHSVDPNRPAVATARGLDISFIDR